MNVTMAVCSIFDTIQEVVIFKSGIYLNYDEIKTFLKSSESSLADILLTYQNDDYYRFRPEELEVLINEIKVKIGELPDSDPFPIVKLVKDYPEAQEDIANIIGVLKIQLIYFYLNIFIYIK